MVSVEYRGYMSQDWRWSWARGLHRRRGEPRKSAHPHRLSTRQPCSPPRLRRRGAPRAVEQPTRPVHSQRLPWPYVNGDPVHVHAVVVALHVRRGGAAALAGDAAWRVRLGNGLGQAALPTGSSAGRPGRTFAPFSIPPFSFQTSWRAESSGCGTAQGSAFGFLETGGCGLRCLFTSTQYTQRSDRALYSLFRGSMLVRVPCARLRDRRATEVVLVGVGTAVAFWMDERFVRPHPGVGQPRSWRSGERRSDWVDAVSAVGAEGGGAGNRAVPATGVDTAGGPWLRTHSTTTIPGESDLGGDERGVRP